MFQKSLDTKQIPQDWQNANVIPVHKGVAVTVFPIIDLLVLHL